MRDRGVEIAQEGLGGGVDGVALGVGEVLPCGGGAGGGRGEGEVGGADGQEVAVQGGDVRVYFVGFLEEGVGGLGGVEAGVGVVGGEEGGEEGG